MRFNTMPGLLSLLFVFCSQLVLSQTNQYQFSQLNTGNGLSHNQVTCIFKDKKGFIWFGTSSGLNRYDGYKFKIFKHSDKKAGSIDDDFIVNITEGPLNKLWVLTHSGYNIYDPSTERFEHNITHVLAAFSIKDSLVNGIKIDRFGNSWFSHMSLGVYKYDAATGKLSKPQKKNHGRVR